ncbi:MAG: ABC transporter ATP-binding protein [Ktedonobacteraceae bacterium]
MLNITLDTHLNTFHLSLSFSASQGETTVLLGESGAGKSTVLRIVAGLLKPQKGHIAFGDTIYFDSERDIAVPPQERPFGYVFQDYALFPHLTVFENIAFGLRAQHLSRSLIRQRVGAVLEQVHLPGLDQRRPAQLSGGQQQRVAIARALALQPQLLLLDEPLSALDVQTRREVRQELRHILAEIDITTIMVTHTYLEALLFGQLILVLEHGHVLQQGGQRDLLEHPRSAYVAELIGVNFFHGRIMRYESPTICALQIHNGPQPVEVLATLREQEVSTPRPHIGEEAYVIVEPQSVTLYPTQPNSSARNTFRGEVMQIVRVGNAPLSTDKESEGVLRVSLLIDTTMPPLTAEITEASSARLNLHEGSVVYATFKATEARAYT